MIKKNNKNNKKKTCSCGNAYGNACGTTGAVYGLGFIGAAVYFISQSTSFWMGVLGFLKAMVWPAFLVHKLLGA